MPIILRPYPYTSKWVNGKMSEARGTLKDRWVELNICVKTDQFHLVSVSITLLQSCQALPKSIRRVSLGPLVSRCVSHVPYISHFFVYFRSCHIWWDHSWPLHAVWGVFFFQKLRRRPFVLRFLLRNQNYIFIFFDKVVLSVGPH